MKTFRFSLTYTILAALSFLLILTWLLLSLASFKISEKDMIAQKNEEGRVLLASFVLLLPEKFVPGNSSAAAYRFADGLTANDNFKGILVVDRNLREFYRNRDTEGIEQRLLDVLKSGRESGAVSRDRVHLFRYAPVREGSEVVGAARLTMSLVPEQKRLSGSRNLYLAYFSLIFLLMLGLGYYILSRCIVFPVRKLLTSTAKIGAGDLDFRIPVPGSRELAELAEAFNAMVDALRGKRCEVESHIRSLERINRELQSAREETVRSEKLASVGLLAAGTAHEIGTPLAAIMGFATIIRDEIGEQVEIKDYLSRILEEAGRIDRTVRALMDFSRPSPSEEEDVDVGELLRETVDLLEGQGALKNIITNLRVDEKLPSIVTGRHELQQVFINLFINARDAMPGGGTLDIELTRDAEETWEELQGPQDGNVMGRRKSDFRGAFHVQKCPGNGGGWMRLLVSDTGMGIAAENLERIFDPFFTTKEPGKGTGLGLAVTARIIDSIGGRLTVESVPSKGSTFTIWLPVQ
jgi:two-component system, NtrC family, sensor kinase